MADVLNSIGVRCSEKSSNPVHFLKAAFLTKSENHKIRCGALLGELQHVDWNSCEMNGFL